MGKLIYLDNAATTKTAPEVVDAMLPYFTEHFGNPSSVYGFAAANKEADHKTERNHSKEHLVRRQRRFISQLVVLNLITGR